MLDSNIVKTYINAMELLVEEELRQQLASLPDQKMSYMNQMELIAYALNQLPPLYATGEKGLNYQLAQGRKKLGVQIHQAVRRSIMAVQRDPLLSYIPLQAQPPAGFREVLYQLQVILKRDRIDWLMLPQIIEQALYHAARSKGNWFQYVPQSMPMQLNGLPTDVPRIKAPARVSRSQDVLDSTGEPSGELSGEILPDSGWDHPLSIR